MQSTISDDATSPTTDAPLRLRVEVIDALMGCSIAEQARRFGINRQHYFDMRKQNDPALPGIAVALRVASVARTSVEALWGI